MSQKGIGHILIILILAAVASLGVVLWSKFNFKQSASSNAITSPVPQSSDMTMEAPISGAIELDQLIPVVGNPVFTNDEKTTITNYNIFKLGDKFSLAGKFSTGTGRYYGNSIPVLGSNGNIYIQEQDRISVYNLDSKQKTDLYKIPDPNYEFIGFSYNENQNKLFVTERKNEASFDENKLTMKEIDLKTGLVRELADFKQVFYGGKNYMFQDGEFDIVTSIGGDGCGGWGDIFRLTKTSSEKILTTGVGCSEDPRFLGFDAPKSLIYLYSIKPGVESQSDAVEFNQVADKLYTYNTKTGQTETLYDFKEPGNKNSDIFLSSSKDKIAVLQGKALRVINLTSKQPENEIQLEDGYHISGFINDKVFLQNYEKYLMQVWDANKNTIKTYSWQNQPDKINFSPTILGEYKDDLIAYDQTF